MSLLGRAAWWLPRPLDKALPNLDIEGETLRQDLDEPAAEEKTYAPVG
jgi:RND superfamily putative drug exporter